MYNSCMPHALHDQLPCNRQSIDSMAIQFKLPWALPPVLGELEEGPWELYQQN